MEIPFSDMNPFSKTKTPPPESTPEEEVKLIPTTFREAEILGLRLMQEAKYEEALSGTLRYVPSFDFEHTCSKK